MLTTEARSYIDSYGMLPHGATVLVAVSGGPDSMALLALLHRLQAIYGIHLTIVHVDHQLRGGESARDALFVRQQAARLGIPCRVVQVDANRFRQTSGLSPLSPQHAARELRYAALARLQQQLGADRVALGHIADDQTETLLIRLLRGTGPAGLAGMPPIRLPYVRPLMAIRRQTLIDFLRTESIPWVQDSSNIKRIYQRNRVRLDVLPVLRQHNPQIDQRLYELTEMMAAEHDLLERQVDAWYSCIVSQRSNRRLILQCHHYEHVPLAIQRRLLRRLTDQYIVPPAAIHFRHIEHLRCLLTRGKVGQRLTLPGQWLVERHHDVAIMWREHAVTDGAQAVMLSVPGQAILEELDAVVTAEFLRAVPSPLAPGRDVVYIDAATIQTPLTVRTRWPGARFHPLGAPGHKKLKSFFIDKKIPRAERERIPLVANGAEIVWVAGYQLGNRFRIRPETQRAVRLQYLTRSMTVNTPVTSQLQPLLHANMIQERVSALGTQLNADYAQSEAVRVIGVLKGAWIFLADLVRQLDLPVSCDFLGVSSYGQASSSGVLRMTTDLNEPIAGLDVILVEDIVDTGLTMRFLLKTLALREPRSIRTCTLLDKPSRRRVPFTPDYVGFTIPDQFVVGYGLDWAGAYRHLPYIAIWQPQDG